MLLNKTFALLGLLLITSLSSFAYAQELETAPKKLSKKEMRVLKRSFKKLSKRILESEDLSREYLNLINTCKDEDTECQERLNELVQSTMQGTNLEQQANGMMFGICKPKLDSKGTHKLVYSKRQYDCKLSSHGKVYDRTVERKLFGPGLWWEKQSIVLFCTGPAYGKKMTGFSVAAGAFVGITATTMVGKVGVCLAVGAGKSAGFFVGAETYNYEALEAKN